MPFFCVNQLSHEPILVLKDVNISFFLSTSYFLHKYGFFWNIFLAFFSFFLPAIFCTNMVSQYILGYFYNWTHKSYSNIFVKIRSILQINQQLLLWWFISSRASLQISSWKVYWEFYKTLGDFYNLRQDVHLYT